MYAGQTNIGRHYRYSTFNAKLMSLASNISLQVPVQLVCAEVEVGVNGFCCFLHDSDYTGKVNGSHSPRSDHAYNLDQV